LETNELSLNDIDPLHEGEIYWMMLDRSGTGKYPFRETMYIPCRIASLPLGLISFSSVVFDDDQSGNDVFTLLAAPSFFTNSKTLPPSCAAPNSGSINTEIAGGTPPFDLVLTGITDKSFQLLTAQNNMDHVFEAINQGEYLLRVKDARGNICSERIFVSNDHLWESALYQNYKLSQGESIILDASDGMPAIDYFYSWTTPDGTVENNSEILIDQPGDYLLSVTDEDNCNSTLQIHVMQTGTSNFRGVELFPNPTAEWFVLRMNLENHADVTISITDISGRVLQQKQLYNERYYMYTDKIKHPGTYLVTLISGNERETLELIVQ
jgi:hypothetical protein